MEQQSLVSRGSLVDVDYRGRSYWWSLEEMMSEELQTVNSQMSAVEPETASTQSDDEKRAIPL